MTPRLKRKEIKRDELLDAIETGMAFLKSHSRKLIAGAASVVALLVLIAGAVTYFEHRIRRSEEGLSYALKVYDAPIESEHPRPDDPTRPSFADEGSLRNRARSLLEELRSEYPRSEAAAVAAIYLGNLEAQEDRLERARHYWEEYLDKHERGLLAVGVRLSLLRLDRQEGRAEEVAERLRSELDGGEARMPEEIVLYELAATLEELGRSAEAEETYRRLGDEYPESIYAVLARQRLALLGSEGGAS